MQTLSERVRRARSFSKMSQQALAVAAGVQRSAVAQWERKDGSHPSMLHLIAIAQATGVYLEWLGTGRGTIRPETDIWTSAAREADFAQDELEAECLLSLRRIPLRIRENLVSVITLVSKNF